MKLTDMTIEQLLGQIAGATSVSSDVEQGRSWVWAGYTAHEEIGDGTAACRELVARGVLLSDDPTDGYHCFEIAAEWQGRHQALR